MYIFIEQLLNWDDHIYDKLYRQVDNHTRGITPNVYRSSEAWVYGRRLQLSGSDHVTGQRSMFDEYDWSRDSINDARLWQRSLKIIEIVAIQKLTYGFLFAFYSNYGRICSRVWDI